MTTCIVESENKLYYWNDLSGIWLTEEEWWRHPDFMKRVNIVSEERKRR